MTEQNPGPEHSWQAGHGQQPYPSAAQQPTHGSGSPGGLGKRFLARLVDSILVGIVAFIVSSLIGMIIASGGGNAMSAAPGSVGGPWILTFVTTVLTVAINLGYFTLLESNRGQSLGKMLVGLRVLGPDGGNPTTTGAFKRNIWLGASILGIVPVVGGFFGGIVGLVAAILIAVGISNDTVTRKGWHDTFAGGTRVVTTQ